VEEDVPERAGIDVLRVSSFLHIFSVLRRGGRRVFNVDIGDIDIGDVDIGDATWRETATFAYATLSFVRPKLLACLSGDVQLTVLALATSISTSTLATSSTLFAARRTRNLLCRQLPMLDVCSLWMQLDCLRFSCEMRVFRTDCTFQPELLEPPQR